MMQEVSKEGAMEHRPPEIYGKPEWLASMLRQWRITLQ